MKKSLRGKLLKTVAIFAVAAACGATCVSLSGCNKTQKYDGEMHYEQYGVNFGIKVSVEVQSDKKGDRIRKVSVLNSDYVSASPSGWDKDKWDDNLQTLLNAYRGMYVKDVLALDVVTAENGAPYVRTDDKFSDFGGNLIITGATLGSGRLLLAVQDALSKANGYEVVEGEYGYVSYGTNYGVKVRVILKDGVIKKVVTLTSDYTNATASWNTALWYDKADVILAAFEGKTAAEINGITATVGGQDGATENVVSDSAFLATDATLSSARLMLAVQNALSKIQG